VKGSNILSVKDNISGGSINVFLSLLSLMVAIFIECTGMHEKPERVHVMQDGGTGHIKFLSRG
jgi:hypothetical protein